MRLHAKSRLILFMMECNVKTLLTDSLVIKRIKTVLISHLGQQRIFQFGNCKRNVVCYISYTRRFQTHIYQSISSISLVLFLKVCKITTKYYLSGIISTVDD